MYKYCFYLTDTVNAVDDLQYGVAPDIANNIEVHDIVLETGNVFAGPSSVYNYFALAIQ